MELQARVLTEKDWDTLVSWWDKWPEWVNPPKDFLPNNGTGGFMIEKEGKPIVAGFVYFTNSRSVLLEWIISDPEYRDDDRQQALELLITGAENVCKAQGFKYVLFVGKHNNLINTFEKLGWNKNGDYGQIYRDFLLSTMHSMKKGLYLDHTQKTHNATPPLVFGKVSAKEGSEKWRD